MNTVQAFVGYRDFGHEAGDWTGPEGHFMIQDFVDASSFDAMKSTLGCVYSGGGGDCEDVTGALKASAQ